MADLNPLIRVRKHDVDEKQKKLSVLYRQYETMDGEKNSILDTLDKERQSLSDQATPEMIGYFGAYSKSIKKRLETLEAEMKKLDARMDVARDEVRRAFAELKKVEMTQERREKEERKEQDKKESDMLDEIAIEGYRRKLAEEEG